MVALRIAGRRTFSRAGAVAVAMGLALAAGGPALAAAHPALGAAHPALGAAHPAVSLNQADHWGFFFGDKSSADNDLNLSPAAIDLPAPVTQIGSSNSTEYALLNNGQVWAWGQGTEGQLGNGAYANSFTTPVQVKFPKGVQIAFLATDAMPYDTALAVDTMGNAWGWGMNKDSSLCLGNADKHNKPVQLPLTDVTTLAGADGHAVYDSNGTVYTCGKNVDGVLGTGNSQSTKVPVPIPALAGQAVTQVYSSWENAGALLANGEYFDWGFDSHGELGNGTSGPGHNANAPVLVNFPDSTGVTQVAQGGSANTNGQTIVMLSDGSLYAWGDDAFYQLGDGKTMVRTSPEQIFAPAGVTYQTLASGGGTSYAITTTGDVYAWGHGTQGEVGNGTKDNAVTPVMVDSGATWISTTGGNVAVG
jgi:alpha-tubulin suppressor-like RCC1 family protein